MIWQKILGLIEAGGSAALVSLVSVEGSVPRNVGTRMVVAPDGALTGTVGGGTLEFDLHRKALALVGSVAGRPAGEKVRHVLGPDLGQCCGGVVEASIEVLTSDDVSWVRPLALAEQAGDTITTLGRVDGAGRLMRRLASEFGGDPGIDHPAGAIRETFGVLRTPVALFGAGHVGRALVLALAPLPFSMTWIDSRADLFPPVMPGDVRTIAPVDPASVVADLGPGALVCVMTHDHALDFSIVRAALGRGDLPYVGLIGSATKRARFLSRLAQTGLEEPVRQRLVCPIGGRRLADKSPAVIAAQIAVDLLEMRERLAAMPAELC